ncbi:MAG: NfeD family protein [Clostridia bacterium]|nr:NfeD family protein [Clostridia bacterium]
MLIEALGPTAIPTIVCFVLGLLFLIIEMFTPGVGVPCVLGLLFLVAVIVMQLGWGSASVALYIVAITLLILILGIILIIRSLQQGRLSRSFLVLDESIAGESTDVSGEANKSLVGRTGETLTPLRPAGIAEIDGRRLDVMTSGAFVQKGKPVRVTNVEGLHILVEETAQEMPAQDIPEA